MKQAINIRLLSVILLTTGCVTVNVYFPAAAAEQAADKIIKQVYGHDEGSAPAPAEPAPTAPPEGEPTSALLQPAARVVLNVLDFVVPAAQAQQPNLDISTPAINKLQASMTARHAQLSAFYTGGAVGMDNNGLITLRDPKAVSIKERNAVNQLVAAENGDRNALYREIAKANGHPDWEADIRGTFARRWVANAPKGWFFQDSGGGWKQK